MTSVWVDEQYFFFVFVLMSVKEDKEMMDREEVELAGKGKAQGGKPRRKLPLHVNTFTAFKTIRCVRYQSESES